MAPCDRSNDELMDYTMWAGQFVTKRLGIKVDMQVFTPYGAATMDGGIPARSSQTNHCGTFASH
jgi:hypothetical protein